jgi:hypothetical protein
MRTQQERPWPSIWLNSASGSRLAPRRGSWLTSFSAMWKTPNRSGQLRFDDLHQGPEGDDLQPAMPASSGAQNYLAAGMLAVADEARPSVRAVRRGKEPLPRFARPASAATIRRSRRRSPAAAKCWVRS